MGGNRNDAVRNKKSAWQCILVNTRNTISIKQFDAVFNELVDQTEFQIAYKGN